MVTTASMAPAGPRDAATRAGASAARITQTTHPAPCRGKARVQLYDRVLGPEAPPAILPVPADRLPSLTPGPLPPADRGGRSAIRLRPGDLREPSGEAPGDQAALLAGHLCLA